MTPASRELTVNGTHHLLAAREATLLEALLRRSNHVIPKSVLEDQLYGLAEEGSPNAIEVYVHRLRKQLDDAGAGAADSHRARGRLSDPRAEMTKPVGSIVSRIIPAHFFCPGGQLGGGVGGGLSFS